ncbi:homocysteine S-methyltransferase family protein, partial [Stomatohabitans albus]
MPDFAKALANTVNDGPIILDGAMGASLQTKELTEADFGGLDGCNEVLVRTRPDVIRDLHLEFLAVGVDAVETDSFGGAPWVLDEYGLGKETEELNRLSAAIAREACDEAYRSSNRSRERFVVGSMGPGTKSPTLSLAKRGDEFDFIATKTMVDGYVRQARGLLAGGADLLLIETVFDLLQAKSAVVACHEAMAAEGITVPIAVSVTIEANINTMLLGSDTSAALYTLEALGIDLIGLNCATGPQDMREHVRYLSEHSRLPIMVVPNAGLPENINGQTCYRLTPEELAASHHEFVTKLGVQMVGGCCGTTPTHLKAVVDAVQRQPVADRAVTFEPGLASLYSAVPWEQENSFHIIGERLNANGSKAFRDYLLAEDMNAMLKIARTQTAEGANSLDVCVDYVGRNGVDDMVPLVNQLATTSTLPLVIDSTQTDVIEAALIRMAGRAVINSVNLEDGRTKADVLLPLAKKWGHAVIALAIDETGQARTADWKVDVCKRIAEIAINEHGLRAEDLIFDTLTFPLGSGAEDLRKDGMETLEAIRRVKAEIPGCLTTLGLSNVSFGLNPAARQVLNSVFLHHCLEAGLDSAIVHASKILPLARIDDEARITCEDLIFDRRGTAGRDGTAGEDYDPLMHLIELFEGAKVADDGAARLAELTLEERLATRIIDAEREGLNEDLDAAMAAGISPLDIINEHLLAGMKVVGERFGSGEMQLPFVLQSAETMKAAVAYLEPFMDAVDTKAKASIVLATVKGDVHDIGKNL